MRLLTLGLGPVSTSPTMPLARTPVYWSMRLADDGVGGVSGFGNREDDFVDGVIEEEEALEVFFESVILGLELLQNIYRAQPRILGP